MSLQPKVEQVERQLHELRSLLADLPGSADEAVELHESASTNLRICQRILGNSSPRTETRFSVRLQKLQQQLSAMEKTLAPYSKRKHLVPATKGEVPANFNATESLQRSVMLTEESLTIGENTNNTLHQQGEQLKRTHEKLKEVDQMMDQSEYLIRGIKSIRGAFSNMFRKAPAGPTRSEPEIQSARDSKDKKKDEPVDPKQQQPASARAAPIQSTPGWSAPKASQNWGKTSSAPAGDDSNPFGGGEETEEQRRQQMLMEKQIQEESLLAISKNLSHMKRQAQATGDFIKEEQAMLEQFQADAERVTGRIEKNNSQITRILK